MEEIFGSECWVEKLKLRPKTLEEVYKGKAMKRLKKDKILTYHHIIMRKDGGKPTIANGALLSEENHTWLHKQQQWKQDKINEYFQQYKINFILASFDDNLAIKATRLQIDYDELQEDYDIIKYDEEVEKINDELYSRAKAQIKEEKGSSDRDER